MNNVAVQIGAATGACAVVAGIAIGAIAGRGDQAAGFSSAPEQTEITQTTQLAPSEPEVSEAKPQITGPAPLPPEERGLPGN